MRTKLKESLEKNLLWFESSGIMSPPDGGWGVAERIVVTKGNEALGKIFDAFPTYVEYDGYAVLENRRPDCNFETALLFLLAHEVSGGAGNLRTAENLLRYLYRRSGMLNKGRSADRPPNTWKWEHSQWGAGTPWFDDNAWNCVIPLIIARRRPELDALFGLRQSALLLAVELEKGFASHFPTPEANLVPARKWSGNVKSPHWGSLLMMAFAFAFAETGEAKYAEAIHKYNSHLAENAEGFSASECAYAVIGCSSAAAALDDNGLLDMAHRFASILLSRMDGATGHIHSEWGNEAPTGKMLVDLIYTQNWAALALLSLRAVTKEGRFDAAFEKMLELLVSIQDSSPEPQFKGCWRGMYDMEAGRWGGGDRYEGGANSIYSGWTNAPIAIAIASSLLGVSPLTDSLRKG